MASRGGRGRGGYKAPTGAQLFLQRSAQESGLDERNLRSLQDLTRPSLFPDLTWHSSGTLWNGTDEDASATIVTPKRTQSQIYLIRKAREIQHRMRTSPYYVLPSLETDVARYRKRSRTQGQPCDKIVRDHMGSRLASSYFVPEELLGPKKATVKAIPEFDADGVEIKVEPGEGEEEEEEDGESVIVEEEEVEEEAEDYTTNYYASDDESDGGGGDDAEPTF